MAIEFSCPGCGRRYRVGEGFGGRRVRCKACDHEIAVPLPREADGDVYELSELEALGQGVIRELPRPAPVSSQPAGPRGVTARGVRGKWAESEGIDWGGLLRGRVAGVVILIIVAVVGVYELGRLALGPRGAGRARQEQSAGQQVAKKVEPVQFDSPPPAFRAAPRPAGHPTAAVATLDLGSGPGPEPVFSTTQGGVQMAEAWIGAGQPFGDENMRARIYLPSGEHEPRSLPCVFIAPAGTNMVTGMRVEDGDAPEHLPYARAGFAVVAYDLSGPAPTGAKLARAARLFVDADGGLLNARRAIDYALGRLPQIDPGRLYVAGHSSAATVALRVAAKDKRIGAAVAFAPVSDISAHFAESVGEFGIRSLQNQIPNLRPFMWDNSPVNFASELTCPTYLFHAQDDETVPIEQSRILASLNEKIHFVPTRSGGHYDSMIEVGIPSAVAWLKSVAAGVGGGTR